MKKKIIIILIAIVAVIVAISAYFIIKNIQEDNKKYEIETIAEYKYFVVKENEKYGVIDTKGNKIIEAKYQDVKIPNPQKDVFICYENDTTKIMNEKGEEIFTEYENIEPLRLKNVLSDLMYEKSVLKYSKDGKYGIIDLNGKKITNAKYEEIDTLQFKEGELLVKKDGKYGVINIKGTTLVKAEYDKIEADRFYEEGNSYKKSGYIVSETTEEGYRYGYVNLEGKQIIETKYNDLYRIIDINSEDAYIICAENGKYGLLKNNKQIINNEYQSIIYNESNNTLTALRGKKYGVISIEGKTIVPFEYKQIDITGEYIYATTTDENMKIFDSKGAETNMDKNMAIIDGNEKTKVEFNYNSMQKIENTNMVQATNNDTNTTEIYSKEMNKISELKNATIKNNKEYIKLYNDEETKYISKDEKEVKNTEVFTDNKIFAKKSGDKWGFVDANNNKVLDYKYDKVTEVNKYGFAGIKQNGRWGIVDENGKIIVNPKYKLNDIEPIFIGEYYQVIYGNGEIYYTK